MPLSFETKVSMAVAAIQYEHNLKMLMDYVEKLAPVQLDRKQILNIWRDVKRVPIHRSVKSWKHIYEE